MSTKSALVTAVVLNYQHSEDTLRCVASLQRLSHSSLFVIVVDNDSGPEALDVLDRGLDPCVHVIVNEENLGYAGGNNVGISAALERNADFVWLVNPDVVADEDALRELVMTSERHPNAGIIGSRILYGGSEPSKIWFDGGIIDWTASGSTTHLHMGALEADHRPGGPHDVDYVTGAGMMLRRHMVEQIGLLPESWFLYFEETDYNLTAREHGWRTLVNPKSRLHHYKRSTGILPTPYYIYYFVRNRVRFGITRADATPEQVASDLRPFVDAWRNKVSNHDPDWTPSYDLLVDEAMRDGANLITGKRDLEPFAWTSS